MRTTIDLPDALYRQLKARAALQGITFRELLEALVEKGLQQPEEPGPRNFGRTDTPPAFVPPRGIPIPLLTRNDIYKIEEEEEIGRDGSA
jgi:hypothetical protein